MVGVDLSAKMLEKAEARGVYDALEREDIVSALKRSPRSYDLVLAADVLVYVGDLRPMMAATVAALRPMGVFLCSVESHSENQDFRLNPTVRYSHSPTYVESVAVEAGMSVLVSRSATGRNQDAAPVAGHLFAFQVPSSHSSSLPTD